MNQAVSNRVNDAIVLKIAYCDMFDLAYYSREAGQEFGSVRDAARDYCERGWRSGLNPSRLFDTKRYLRNNDDVRSAGTNPLEHFISHGEREGRTPRAGLGMISDRPTAPEGSVWDSLPRSRGNGLPYGVGVDVVVPVYRGYDDTLACLFSVLTAGSSRPFELIVINDCSPEPELTVHLRALAEQGLFRLIENEVNLGFVGSANVGMFLHPDRDVVLLNADTVVFDGWLDRLTWHASQAHAGTVTPLSNNATICSYPRTLENNNCDLEIEHAEIDRLCAEANRRQSVEAPTGVGFCFYVKRDVLDRIGGFDAESFGIGYGEENDFCMRAAKDGWRNLIALDVYVRHTGEVSFSATATAQKTRGLLKLNSLHPQYSGLVQAFIDADPVAPAREAIDLARLVRANAGRGVTVVDHGWIGGILRHLNEITGELAKSGVTVTRLAPVEGGARLALTALSPLDLPNLPSVAADDVQAMEGLLRSLGLDFVHVHSLVNHRLENFERLTSAVQGAGLRYHLTIHDYAPVCPRITMVDWGGSYCASPSTNYCRTCIGKVGTEFGPVDIDDWRSAYGHIIEGAASILVPDEDVEARLRHYVDIPRDVLVRPHEVWRERKATPMRRPPSAERGRTIGVIGAIGPHKGSGVLLAMAGDITTRRLPLRIKLYGYSDRIELDQFDCVSVTGRYREEEIESIVAADPCDFVFFPSVWPETYSYTLDNAFRLGLHPVCFDIGAAAARLKRFGVGHLLPLSLIYDIEALNDALMMIAPQPYALEPLGPEAWWGSEVRYYGEERVAAAKLRAAE